MGLPDIDNIPASGAVFTIGRSRFADNFASHFFIRQDPVVTIECGDEHSAVVCQSGRLFVFGSNDWGQLGLGHKNHVSKPSCVKILKPEKVTHVACGRAHTLICTGGQKIFTCGTDQEGQLGRGGLAAGDSSSSPTLVYDCGLTGPRIIQVTAGSHHSMALISDGTVMAWGSNLEGQLGLPGTTGLVNKPTRVKTSEPVKAISAGYYHTAFLTESGLIYVCGESESGKLGIVTNFSSHAAPKQLQLPGPAAKIACGGHHTLILTETGDLYCFGSNISGQLGMGVNVTEVDTPKLFPRGDTEGEVITKIATGESHTAVVTESGKLFMCGDGRHGKLGLEENENNVHEMTHAVKYDELTITDVSCGGCHTILVGKRQEDTDEDSGTTQSDIVQRKNSLPPLKIPAMGRIAADILPDKSDLDNAIKSVENGITEVREHAKDAVASVKTDLQNSVEGAFKNIEDTVKQDVEVVRKNAEDVMEHVKDAVSDIKKPEFPKKLADYIEEGNKTEELLNELANETGEVVNHGADGVEKPKSRRQSTASMKSTISAQSHHSIEGKRKPSVGSAGQMQKAEVTMDEHQIPPPKPPRLRSGLLENLEGEKVAYMTNEVLRNAGKMGREGSGTSKNPFEDNEDVHDEGGEAVMKSNSRKGSKDGNERESSHRREEDITRVEGKGEKNAGGEVEPEKGEAEKAQDDADVVQSPPPRTGKMAKLFKGKRPQVEQNGVKGSSASNSKVKSRTCTVL